MNDHDDRTPFDERDDRALEAEIARLPRAIEPERDLWPRIAARLGPPQAARPARRGWTLALAAVLLATLAGVGFGLFRMARSGPGAERRAAAPAVTAPEAAPAETAAAVPAADAFGNRLMAALERKRYQLGPDAAAAVEADIARLGLAIAELVAAVSEHPDSPALYHQLASRQRQEADLLLRLNRL